MILGKLKGRTALITGGTSGIGAATAKLFQTEGASVIVTGSSPKSVEAIEHQLPGVTAITSDAADVNAVKQLIDAVKNRFGHIDILFLNAGIGRVAPVMSTEESTFDELFSTNIRGPYFLLKYALPVLTDGASVILTSSGAALQAAPGQSAYAASKAALQSLGKTFAIELAPRHIRVNTITPGPINTPISGKMGLTAEQQTGFAKMAARIPLGRVGEPEEIAAAALYFASDDSRFTTGANLVVDGGLTLA